MSYTEGVGASQNTPAKTVTGAAQIAVNAGLLTISDVSTLSTDDTLSICKLPAMHIPVDILLYSDQLDTDGTPTLTFDVGIGALDGTVATADLFFADSDFAQTATVGRATKSDFALIAATNVERLVILTVTAEAATAGTDKIVKCCLLSIPV